MHTSMKNKIIFWIAALLLVGITAFWIYGKPADQGGRPGGGRHGSGDGKPVPVQAAVAKRGDIDVSVDALGTVTALTTATVNARVSGLLVRVPFREGQLVKEGALLAEIDPRPYQVLLDQAKGQLIRDQALLEEARLDLERYRGLLAKDSIAKQQFEDQELLVRQNAGVVKMDQAAVDSAQLNLDFTHITAPVSGLLGLRQMDAGNMISATSSSGSSSSSGALVVITRIQPIYVIFAIPADNIPAVQARLKAGETLSVIAFDRDSKNKLANGKLLSIDNLINVNTGTVNLKAEFDNADNKLFPNQFVNARLRLETRHNAILAPVAAIQRGTQGTFVYVIGQNQAVSVRPVTLGPVAGDSVSIEKGIAAGEQIVTDGADKLRDGAKVEVATPGAGKAPRSGGSSPDGKETSPEEKQKRWAELNARIDRGEFGEEIKKLPEEERKQRMREMRHSREGGGSGGQNSQ
jgi:multidrug efflux system membrane fusion protein